MSNTISKVYVTIHGIRYDLALTETNITEDVYRTFVDLCFTGKVEWSEARDPDGRIVIIGKESLKQGIFNHEVLQSKQTI